MNADSPSVGFFQGTISTAAKTLNVFASYTAAPASAHGVLVQAQDQDIRWRDDGTSPTATVGMLLKAGTTLEYHGDMDAIQIIRATADAVVSLSYR